MTRPLRINVENGWYHITSRGQNRQKIYDDVADRKDFLARIEEMTKRFDVEIHAYVLMSNHYHLLIRTPRANASQTMQWLNNGYGMWRNRRHNYTGHVFQGRYKGILVEGGQWLLSLSTYIHFNPIAVKALGWGKQQKKAEGLGALSPTAKVVRARHETLRNYRWSSYRSYAGYETAPPWLTTKTITDLIGGRDQYREFAEKQLQQGHQESIWMKLRWGVILGSTAFGDSMRERASVFRETRGRRDLRKRVEWTEIVDAMERIKGEPWAAFVNRYGDWGRDMAFWIARRRGGMRLQELGDCVDGLDYSAVSEAVRTFERKCQQDRKIKQMLAKVCQYLNLET